MERRSFLKMAAALAALPATGTLARAQDFAQLKILIPSGPGGGWDITGRTVDKVLRGAGLVGSSRITNVAGAGGTVGLATFVNQYRRDPAALMVGGLVMVTNILSNKSPVNLTNVTPIARLTGEFQAVAVPANSPFKTLGDLVAAFKADPQKVSWVGGSAGGTDHIVAALIAAQLGIPATALTYVGYPSGGEIQAAVLGGQASVGVSGLSEFSEHVAAGGMRLLGITAPERIAGIDAPTLREQGIDVEISNWRGLFAAPDISAKDREALLALIGAMVKTDLWAQELKARNWTSVYLPGEEFAAFIAAENRRIGATLKELGLV
ncbi:Bug family tripartite tricarboxylate transporter substrate binding protein [Ancylobacter terrae]|uniref:Bug family tripartite tricarboxylate transporter substrate binding protein n=1 Tax=Ancylobacter sp. sgz301288 TaxID=3342077 RepID=UPI00385B8CAD